MMSSRRDWLLIVSGLAFLAVGTAARAEVTSITFAKSSPYGTTTFGTAGAYEQLDGVVTGEINPDHPGHRESEAERPWERRVRDDVLPPQACPPGKQQPHSRL